MISRRDKRRHYGVVLPSALGPVHGFISVPDEFPLEGLFAGQQTEGHADAGRHKDLAAV